MPIIERFPGGFAAGFTDEELKNWPRKKTIRKKNSFRMFCNRGD